ncbi:MAG: type IV secretion protein Rhs, partial [Betaproteobacteria bacterium]
AEDKLYDARFGTLSQLTGPNGLVTSWQYDGFGRKTREQRADGTTTTWAYKLCTEANTNCPSTIAGTAVPISQVVIEQSFAVNQASNAPEKRQYYDSFNRVVRTQTQGYDGAAAAPLVWQDTLYDSLGRVARQSNTYASTQSAVWSEYTYDALGRVTQEVRPDPKGRSGVATTTYAYNGLSSTVTNENGQTKTTVKNAQGQVVSVTDAQGSTIAYSYDALGNLTQTNAAGSITTLVYEGNNKVAMQDPAMGSWIYAYNIYGELVNQRDSLNQTTSLAYDLLGRMVKRTEPDLVSDWSFDKKFDGTACGKGIGKLCEAKSNNGYNRTHAYDSLGRAASTATVLDNAAIPATVSETFDANTGRVATKTWPTGYQASYSYSPLGYLQSVTGGGTAGFSQTTSYQILAMNAQGQITQYKTGNNVTTVSSYDLQTQRLVGRTATTDGQASGNVLNQSYSYDAQGNLLTRNDNAPAVGTQESFSYDSLNRLTLASILGGALGSASSTQVMYDARGNISYKSDVGRYWYDAARPNRMTNVTLETAAGATVA